MHRRWAAKREKGKESGSPLANLYQISVKLCGVGIGTYLLESTDDVVGALLVLFLFLASPWGSHAGCFRQASCCGAGLLRLSSRILFPLGLCAFKCDIRSR